MQRWSENRVGSWFSELPWIVGCNFIPSTASNQLEMWQMDTFDPETIDRELGLAAGLGMNAVRVYLHDLVWSSGAQAFKDRIDAFLEIADSHAIRTVFVLFDDCWNANPEAGPQADPIPGVHNSRWVQSPGVRAATDPVQFPRLKSYLTDIVGSFSADKRILFWDLYNEPGNFFLPGMSKKPMAKALYLAKNLMRLYARSIPTQPLLEAAFAWARSVSPEQPLTAAVWFSHKRLNRLLIRLSDLITFHHYGKPEGLEKMILSMARYNRPLMCTEYLARSAGCTFESHMPVFADKSVGCFNWGLVSGKTQTVFSWADSRSDVGDVTEPAVWFHDIFRADGSLYSEAEGAFIREMTSAMGTR